MTARDSEAIKVQMRTLVATAHSAQSRNGGRVPYAAHVLSVAEILRDALEVTGELIADPDLALDMYLAALGHDLYEDTSVEPADIRRQFGPRVDEFIEGMTNRAGDNSRADYVTRMKTAKEAVRLIKVADLVDNVTSCAYGIHDLGHQWVRDTFLPIASEMSSTVSSVEYAGLPRTATILLEWLQFALLRLRANLVIERTLQAPAPALIDWDEWNGKLTGEDPQVTLRRIWEREWREGALTKGGHNFPVGDVKSLPGRGGDE